MTAPPRLVAESCSKKHVENPVSSRRIKRREFLATTAGGLGPPRLVSGGESRRGAESIHPHSADRVSRLTAGVSGLPPREICFERARLMTESYRQTVGERAADCCARRKPSWRSRWTFDPGPPRRTVVGNIASKPRVAYFARKVTAGKTINPAASSVLKSELVYGRTSAFRIPEDIAEFWRKMPEGRHRRAPRADYSRVLRLGFSGLRAEAKRECEQHRIAGSLDAAKEAFYLAADLVCQAGERFAARHADAVRALAPAEVSPTVVPNWSGSRPFVNAWPPRRRRRTFVRRCRRSGSRIV